MKLQNQKEVPDAKWYNYNKISTTLRLLCLAIQQIHANQSLIFHRY